MIVQGDARRIPLADGVVQCVVTSPPYWGLRKYAGVQDLIWGGTPKIKITLEQIPCEHEWASNGFTHEHPDRSTVGKDANGNGAFCDERGVQDAKTERGLVAALGDTCLWCGAWRGGFGLEPSIEMYIAHTVEILREIRRVLRPDGVVFWNIGDSYANDAKWGDATGGKHSADLHGDSGIGRQKKISGLKPKDLCLIPERVAIAAQADGWWVRSMIIWAKPNPMPESCKDRPTDAYEHIVMLTKSKRYFWDQIGASNADAARAADSTSLGRPALTPERDSTLNADDGTAYLNGSCDLGENEIAINCTVAFQAERLEIFKSICFTIIGEESERSFVMDLQSSPNSTSLASIFVAIQRCAAGRSPIRATIVNPSPSKSGTLFTDAMNRIPSPETFTSAEASIDAVAILTDIAGKGNSTSVAFYFDDFSAPLFVQGTFRSAHVSHDTRNMRNVWTFPTQPYAGEHFATFPEEIPRRCILAATSERGACARCGAPWQRIVEPSEEYAKHLSKSLGNSGEKEMSEGKARGFGDPRVIAEYLTIGWEATCLCNIHDVKPCIVLDPFGGSGTTARVAVELNRHAVSLDLAYHEHAERRTRHVQRRLVQA
jgi:DNA modification methylase